MTYAVMTVFGWMFMIVAWIAILSIVIYCFSKLLKEEKTRDTEE